MPVTWLWEQYNLRNFSKVLAHVPIFMLPIFKKIFWDNENIVSFVRHYFLNEISSLKEILKYNCF
jgi:lipid A disaccharide synthetase